jgi:type II secretory pathway pseudopilin PulG
MRFFRKLKRNTNKGMSYVELIVVLSIFGAMSSIVLFNYGEFQAKVDIKNLANDIALKVVEAQKAATQGQLTTHNYIASWKPSYGAYFTLTTNGLADNKSFNYFADLNNNQNYDDSTCTPASLAGECLEKLIITKGNSISAITAYYSSGSTQNLNNVMMIFTRPSQEARFFSSASISSGLSYIQITVSSLKTATARIKIYPSGRIQIN